MTLVYLMPLGQVAPVVLDVMSAAIERAFGLPSTIGPGLRDIAYAFDRTRNQYHVSKLLMEIIKDPPSDARRIVGVTEADLFLPIFTFVFGEAQLQGLGAILSTYRLHNEFYGLRHDPPLYAERIEKETVHELGHTFGLVHCYDPVCVMRSSTYVEDVDQKSAEFCSSCRTKLSERFSRR
ncbi:MAG: archaemetzincin family Zn-dependent metalloprotease [Candidatus Lernaella stagnicola]|nr:archaemetzincin family Zn-dependent metalloprotease [Candidatus Lernaella stagnicola]